jgi:hypothetical protein
MSAVMKYSRLTIIALVLEFAFTGRVMAAELEKDKGANLHKAATNDYYSPFLINNIFNWYSNTGDGSFNYIVLQSGFEFPKGSLKTATFEDGLVWGGFHKGRSTPKVGGSTYWRGLQAGAILTPGTATTDPIADNPDLTKYRIYSVRPDVTPQTAFSSVQAMLEVEAALINRWKTLVSAQDLYNTYVQDWNEWPGNDGAPFDDVNGNGVYEPSIDIPGVPGAHQTLWYVANDMNTARVAGLYGSPPIGIEMQRTLWGYVSPSDIGNTIFIRTRIINKSGASIDSMFITQWSDPDLGDAGDDYAGCDTTRELGFVYNARPSDAVYGYAVPAVGYTLLAGPEVPGTPSDTATIGWTKRPGFRNLNLSSFVIFIGGNATYSDPRHGSGGDIQWYCMMNGLSGTCDPFIDPTTGMATKFPLAGDPVKGQGWIDGSPPFLYAGDRRIVMTAGPITVANGDTQEVVVAHLVAQGGDRLSSVSALKTATDRVRSFFSHLPPFAFPKFSAVAQYPTSSNAKVSILADARVSKVRSISTAVKRQDGSTVAVVELFDDGVHGDGQANDGVFGGAVTIPREPGSLAIDGTATDIQNRSYTWERIVEHITTAGPLEVSEPLVVSDNVNNDGIANAGEDVRYTIAVRNNTGLSLSNLTAAAGGSGLRITSLGAGGVDSMLYNPADPNSYMSVQIPDNFSASRLMIPVTIYDETGNWWADTISMNVSPALYSLRTVSLYDNHVSGPAQGYFNLLVVDPSQLTGHLYAIRGVDSIDTSGDHGFTLKDSTTGRVLLANQPVTDNLGHTTPTTDGFKVLSAYLETRSGTMSYGSFSTTSPFSAVHVTNTLDLEDFAGTMGNAYDHWYSGGVPYKRQHSVLLEFAATDSSGNLLSRNDTLASYAYRYLRNANAPSANPSFAPFIKNPSPGYAYQDYTRSLPFAAYDIDGSAPVRLMVGYLENNVAGGLVDGKYWPPIGVGGAPATTDNGLEIGPREWFFIFDVPYSQTPSSALQVDIYSNHVPLMWIGIPSRTSQKGFSRGDQFTIVAKHAPSAVDLWTFTLKHDDYLPSAYELSQNFPNPFNPATTIRYTLPYTSRVTLRIYNILGQEIQTLVDGLEGGGQKEIRWNGVNDSGTKVASGVYFYRLEVKETRESGGLYSSVKKMLLLK